MGDDDNNDTENDDDESQCVLDVRILFFYKNNNKKKGIKKFCDCFGKKKVRALQCFFLHKKFKIIRKASCKGASIVIFAIGRRM